MTMSVDEDPISPHAHISCLSYFTVFTMYLLLVQVVYCKVIKYKKRIVTAFSTRVGMNLEDATIVHCCCLWVPIHMWMNG